MQQNLSRQVTCQTRIEVDPHLDHALSGYAELLSKIERKLFTDFSKGKPFGSLKSEYLKFFPITARQFNSCRITLEGKIRSCKEVRSLQIAQTKDRIKSTKKRISHLIKKKKKEAIHQVKRRLLILEQKLQKLEYDQINHKTRLCFGGKKLFSSQFHKEENGYKNHDQWKKAWQEKRNSQFFLIGSKDETTGNQSCQITLQENGLFSLTIRLPNCMDQKYLTLSDIKISYRKKDLLTCIQENFVRKTLQKKKNPSYKEIGQAINYRFVKDMKGWRVFLSFQLVTPDWENTRHNGCIGIDINTDHIALAETDRFGNIINKKRYDLCFYGKDKNQARAMIGDISAQIVSYAKSCKKPIILERLDFQKKKASFNRRQSKKWARKLSSFAYRTIIETIKSRSWQEKIEVHQVNPAYTSVIGAVNYCKRYGLSPHHSAALVIARRYMGLSERPCSYQIKISDGKGDYVAFFLPERNRKKHVWSFWAEVARKKQAVYVKHFRRGVPSSLDPPGPVPETEHSEDCGRDSHTLAVDKAAWSTQLLISANV